MSAILHLMKNCANFRISIRIFRGCHTLITIVYDDDAKDGRKHRNVSVIMSIVIVVYVSVLIICAPGALDRLVILTICSVKFKVYLY